MRTVFVATTRLADDDGLLSAAYWYTTERPAATWPCCTCVGRLITRAMRWWLAD
jgi:hypothetical protein